MRRYFQRVMGRISIRAKLVISYLILGVLPVLCLGLYSYYTSRTSLLEQMRQTIRENTSSMMYSINSSIERENDNIKYLSYNAGFREKLQNGGKNEMDLAQVLTDSVEPTFWYFITSDDNIKGIQIYSPYISHAVGSFLFPMSNNGYDDWYRTEGMDFRTHWFYEDGSMYAIRALLDAESSSEPIGIMKLEVYPDQIIDPIFQSDYFHNGVLLTDGEKNIIGEKAAESKNLTNEIRTELQKGKQEGFYETDDYLLFVSEPLTNGWQIFYYLDKAVITAQMNKILATTFKIMGICLIAVLILITMMTRALSARILRLKEAAEQVSRGDFNVKLDTEATDEIGVVEASFVEMSRRIQKMIEEMYQLGMEKRAEELKALQAMINPHFLYNCLSSIKWKAIMAEEDEIAEITGQVARFYRTTLNGGRQITTVENELENIKAYLKIQSRTHEGRFDIVYHLDQNGRECEMPNFLLQPIVENAICHGIDQCPEGIRGLIEISYRKEGKYLLFQISNNGPKLDVETVERILSTPGKGYGIYNIRERIRMYYADPSCGLSSGLTDNGMLCFTVRLEDHPNQAASYEKSVTRES
ncbi:MAG: sensor histidine kinase [Bilifractor sp.]